VLQKPLNLDQENVSGSGELKALNDAVKPLSPSEMLPDKPEMINAIEPSNSISDSVDKSAELDGLDTGNILLGLLSWQF